MRGTSLAFWGIASLWVGSATADEGVLACTYGADGEYAIFELYDERTASLRGKVGDAQFNCRVHVESIDVCGPSCHIPLDFTVKGLLDTEHCSAESAQWLRETLNPRLSVSVSLSGNRMYWRPGEASACSAFRIDPAFAAGLGVEARNAVQPPDDIAAYVGLYPLQEVGGTAFLDHPQVQAAVWRTVVDREILRWLFDRGGPKLPIERSGDWLLSSACRAHACTPHHWTLYVAVDGSDAMVCYLDSTRPGGAVWYRRGMPPQRHDGPCPRDG